MATSESTEVKSGRAPQEMDDLQPDKRLIAGSSVPIELSTTENAPTNLKRKLSCAENMPVAEKRTKDETKQEVEEPLTDVNILTHKLPVLVNELQLDDVLPALLPFLIPIEVEAIKALANQREKIHELCSRLKRRTACESYTTFNAFLKIIGGTQPNLFVSLVGRPPTQIEADFCVSSFMQEMKNVIISTNHMLDSSLDRKIDFETEHVELNIIKCDLKSDWALREMFTHDNQLPHTYKVDMAKLQASSNHISASDVLGVNVKKVLMFGRAGSGKTTTLQWQARQWALGKWASMFTMLFLLQFRHLTNTNCHTSATELLNLYGLFQVKDEAKKLFNPSWLGNCASRIIVQIDGLDEVSGFAARLKNTPHISDMSQKAHPIDLCINIIRGNLLSGCTVISTSRPFTGLSEMPCDNMVEILGLSEKGVNTYAERIYPDKAEHIMSTLQQSPLLLSVSGITWYCMMICSLLNDGIGILNEDIKTYTRLIAFIIVQYISRKFPDWPFVVEVGSYFPKLAHMAYMGIFHSGHDAGMTKIVFNEYDLRKIGLVPTDLESIKRGGLLQIKTATIGLRRSVMAEFVHLCVQEILSVTHILFDPLMSKETLSQLFSQGQFNMALLYYFGIKFDKGSDWIKDICAAVQPMESGLTSDIDENMDDKTELILENLCTSVHEESSSKLRLCQLVYEGQVEHHAKRISRHIIHEGRLTIKHTAMTGIDLMAVNFVCQQYMDKLISISFSGVSADDSFMKIMSSTLLLHHTSPLTLNIGDNISAADYKADKVVHNIALQHLDLSKNNIAADGCKILAKHLIQNTTLQHLDVSRNNIAADGCKALADSLVRNTTLQYLNINKNKIDADGCKALAESLVLNTTLQHLDFSMNNIGIDGCKALADNLVHNTTLQHLNLSKNNLDADGCKALAESLVHITLKHLGLRFNAIANDGCKALADSLVHNTNLQYLDVRMNNIGTDGCNALADSLVHNTTLQYLDVSWNHIGTNGCKALAKSLIHNTTLQHLNVTGNWIGADGCKALAKSLADNTTLQHLNIGTNYLGADGCKTFADSLHHNKTLRHLNVSGNNIASDGCKALADGLVHNTTLEHLDVTYNRITSDGCKALAESLVGNTTLQHLDIKCNEIGNDERKEVADMFSHNIHLTILV